MFVSGTGNQISDYSTFVNNSSNGSGILIDKDDKIRDGENEMAQLASFSTDHDVNQNVFIDS